jgi:outer membrane immunogenic protein
MSRLIFAVVCLALSLASARAADVNNASGPYTPPTRYMAPVERAPFTWTGFYIGVNGGYGWAFEHSSSGGFMGGGQLGFNYQLGNNIVVGIEGDADYASIGWRLIGFGDILKWDFVGTVRGRVGYAIDKWLLYGTGGVAWVHYKSPYIASQVLTGSTFGGGVEYAFTHNLTGKLEYFYVGYGAVSGVRAGLNILFH